MRKHKRNIGIYIKCRQYLDNRNGKRGYNDRFLWFDATRQWRYHYDRILDRSWTLVCGIFIGQHDFDVPQPIHLLGHEHVMLKRALIAIGLLASCSASAQSYLVQPNATGCLARTQAQCAALGCDGVLTKYWWPCQTLTDGTVAVVVQPSGPFGPSATVNGVTGTLTTPEQAALVPPATLLTKLPWIISEPAFMARFTAPQIGNINASVDPTVVTNWTAIKGSATTDLTSATVNTLVNRLVVLGLITSANAVTVLAPVAVAQVGQ
jgi:hypothetical protein